MSDITIANTEDSIVDDVVAALETAAVGSTLVFASVQTAIDADYARQKYFTATPLAVVIYTGTDEYEIPDLKRGNVCNLDLLLAVKADTEAGRRTAISRLIGIAKNAISNTPPDDAKAFGVDEELYRRVDWEAPEIESEDNNPWGEVVLSLRIAFVLDDETSH